MHATGVPDALFAGEALPANAAVALVWPRTVALIFVAAWQADGVETVGALPAWQANNVALLRASIVSVDVVAVTAQNVALFAIVVRLASNTIGVG